ncbi:MAG: alpha/beta fold hydrolase [Polyangiaceae bacterium]
MNLTMSDGVVLNVETGGDPNDRLVVLLHGFPQSSRAWLRELDRLVKEGFYVVAPDMRGYGKSEKPSAVSAYKSSRLALDIKEVIEGLGKKSALVVSHDWGAVVAWAVAAFHPEVVEKLIILNGPHPDRIKKLLKTDQDQRKRSWYIFFFQLPMLPELFMRNEKTMPKVLRGATPNAFSEEDISYYRDAARAPGAARAMINYYRASARYGLPRLPKVKAPTLVLWGEQDVALSPKLLEHLDEHVDNLKIEMLPTASHWVIEDAPDEVHAAIRSFFAG